MFSMILFATVFLVSFFSPENLISTAVGTLVAAGATQYLKNATGLQGVGATILAFAVSFVVAIAAFFASTVLSGGHISYELIPQGSLQIFALATMTYKLLLADKLTN